MATLSPASAAAIARLRSYIPPPTTWYSLPLSRRAAVLILLFADKRGDLRVVLTMRSATLKSYAGQAALPGGKTDTMQETPSQTARREASEEIGLPLPSAYSQPTLTASPDTDPSLAVTSRHPLSTKFTPPTPTLPKPFTLEHLCQLPTNLAKTELGVRPVVAYLSANSAVAASTGADVETALIPRLDAKEVAAVFSGSLHGFLRKKDEGEVPAGTDGEWYKGTWIDWHATRFRMHNFYVPVKDRAVSRPRKRRGEVTLTSASQTDSEPALRSIEQAPKDEQGSKYMRASQTLPYRDHPKPYTEENPDPLDSLTSFRVFGMTARILVDCARVAYGEEPEFEHNSHFGDETIIRRLIDVGRMGGPRDRGDEFVGGDLATALEGSGGWGGLVKSEEERKGKL